MGTGSIAYNTFHLYSVNIVPSFLFVCLLFESFVSLVNHINSSLEMFLFVFLEEVFSNNGTGLVQYSVNLLLGIMNASPFHL